MLSFSDLFGPSTWTRVNRPDNSRTHICVREIDHSLYGEKFFQFCNFFRIIFSTADHLPQKRPPYGSDRFARDGLSRSKKKGLAGRAYEKSA